ncbi:MAG TPA: hypothetical protein VE974_06190 [Thermoanaerobaculia bacterium]|nr:hypothetical protein [Thermoanaerobaculia bacterium]
MEDIKKLTIQSVEIVKTGPKKDGSTWTLYRAKTDDGFYSYFDMSLQPGETATFKVEKTTSEKLDRNGQPYVNKNILGYAGSIDNMPAKPYRSTTIGSASPAIGIGTPASPSSPLLAQIEKLGAELQKANVDLLDLAQIVDGLLNRVERLETPAFDQINSVKLTEQDADDMPTF